MKKIITVLFAIMFVFTLSSCGSEDIEVNIMVYSENPEQTVEDLEDLPELLAIELESLGFEFDRVSVRSSSVAHLIVDGLRDGSIDIAIIDSELVTGDDITRVLDVRKEEVQQELSDGDTKTYEKAVVLSNTLAATTFNALTSVGVGFTDLIGMNVCSTTNDEDFVYEYGTVLGAPTIQDIDVNMTLGTTLEVYQALQDGSCDMGIVTLEEMYLYENLWTKEDQVMTDELTVFYTFEPVYYEGFYTLETEDNQVKINAVIQSFIQLSSHNTNHEILDVLGHEGYYIPE